MFRFSDSKPGASSSELAILDRGQPARTVPLILRCQRKGCAAHWPTEGS